MADRGKENIGVIRYLFGMAVFRAMHLQARLFLWFRHTFIRKYGSMREIEGFYGLYYRDAAQKMRAAAPRAAARARGLLLACGVLCVFLLAFARFKGPVQGYWDTYIEAPALLMLDRPVGYTADDGSPLYSYSLAGRLPHDLVGPSTYGISTKDQRIGGALAAAPWALGFNVLGFRVFFALLFALISYLSLRTLTALGAGFGTSLFCSLFLTLNPFILSISALNPNLIGLAVISLLLCLLFEKKYGALLPGLVFGALLGIRNEAVLFLPALIWLLLRQGRGWRGILVFLAASAAALAPVFYWNAFAFGSPLMHPTQFKGLEGFRPTFEHRFLFLSFRFNGMFNFPLHTSIVRTPYFPFPNFLTLPLTLVASAGIALSAFALVGAFTLFREKRGLFVFFALLLVPMYLLLAICENWSEMKMTFLLLVFPPLSVFLAHGLDWTAAGSWKPRRLYPLILSAALLFLLVKACALADFPADPRWYERFPRANDPVFSYVGDDLRTMPEDPALLRSSRDSLTAASLLPSLEYPSLGWKGLGKELSRERGARTLDCVDYWKYIYE